MGDTRRKHSFVVASSGGFWSQIRGEVMAAVFALIAFVLAVLLTLAVAYCFQEKSELEAARQDLARYQGISDLEKYKHEIDARLRQAQSVLPRFETLAEMEQHKARLSHEIAQFEQANAQWEQHLGAQRARFAELEAQTQAVEETLDMQSFGLYRPKYGFEDAERYVHQLEDIREQQKSLTKSDNATHCPQEWTVDGSAAKGRKMVKEHSKLMLRAFNGECDAAIAKVRYNNVNNLENRINRSFEAINKLGAAKQLWITRDYLKLKLQELYLVHEHREMVQAEREEQRRIKQQMREEEKAQREIDKAKKEAEKDELSRREAVERARKELAQARGDQTDRLQALVDRLENELKEAIERKAKAISRAQLTRSGHVYVLSNIGSFGEGVYKIGMTRRFEPLERVKELGDASVPFQYDVHAIIYSEDAPSLEHALHQRFDSRRVNLANTRREFFRVSLDEVRSAVKDHYGEVTFRLTPEAEEYRRTVAMRENGRNRERSPAPVHATAIH
jgi:septal ring factor EnvC (AmiA/AmiB activator)